MSLTSKMANVWFIQVQFNFCCFLELASYAPIHSSRNEGNSYAMNTFFHCS